MIEVCVALRSMLLHQNLSAISLSHQKRGEMHKDFTVWRCQYRWEGTGRQVLAGKAQIYRVKALATSLEVNGSGVLHSMRFGQKQKDGDFVISSTGMLTTH